MRAMGRKKKYFTKEEAIKMLAEEAAETPDSPPEAALDEPAPATDPEDAASPEPVLSEAPPSLAEEVPEPAGDAALIEAPPAVPLVAPGTGPRPRRKKEKAPAPVAPVAIADQPIPAMTVVLSQAIQTLGLGLAASVDDCWKFTDDEAKLLARPIARMMPTTDDPKTELAIALAAVVAPKLILTFQHRRQKMIEVRNGRLYSMPTPEPLAHAPPPAPVPVVIERQEETEALRPFSPIKLQ